MTFLFCYNESTSSLTNLSDLAQIFIAIANLFLAGYVIFYQIRKDRKTENETARINEQNIKLQWFKELIVQPKMEAINQFYSKLHTIQNMINSNDLSIEKKEEINNFVKAELSIVRKSLIDVLQLVDRKFAEELLANLDTLVNGITDAIFNDELKLKVSGVYEKNIGSKISYSKNNLIAQLYNYKGISQ